MEKMTSEVDLTNLPEITEEAPPPEGLILNSTIEAQLDHRTIRAFSEEPLDEKTVSTLLDVARHAATSSFYQAFTILRIKDPAIREVLYQSSGQPYVGGDKGELFVFVADLSRMARIREAAGLSLEPLERATAFVQAVEDALLAAQNLVVAAESLGLGTCYLGSIGRDPIALIEAMQLPKFTFPLVGLLVGHPAQAPQKKPRLPREITVHVDTYPNVDAAEYVAAAKAYDQVIQTYYDLREGGRRQDSYTNQVKKKPGNGPSEKAPLLEVLHDQRLCLH